MILAFASFFFFFNDTATTEIYTLSLHDALPILEQAEGHRAAGLQVGRLPDAARIAVPLFAFELEDARCVVDPEHEQLWLPRLQLLRELELERDVAAVVEPELLAVEPRRDRKSVVWERV